MSGRRIGRHRRQLTGPWGQCWFAPPEAVVLQKLLFFREGRSEKHLEDIRAMLEADSIPDKTLLHDWVNKLGLQAELRRIA